MSTRVTFDAAWYDHAMTDPGELAMEPLETSRWRECYQHIAAWIESDESVMDLGCGTGRLIEAIYRQGHRGRVAGLDWSRAALAEAARYAHPHDPSAPVPRWLLGDLEEWQPRSRFDVYTCTEVLEHLEDDLALVERIPSGARFLITVPNFWAVAHVRVFESEGSVVARYGDLVDFHRYRTLGTPERMFHLCDTRRR